MIDLEIVKEAKEKEEYAVETIIKKFDGYIKKLIINRGYYIRSGDKMILQIGRMAVLVAINDFNDS